MWLRTTLVVTALLVLAAVVQMSFVRQFRWVTADLVMLVVILLALTRMRREVLLAVAFTTGLMIDMLGSSLMGLSGVVLTIVAFAAVRTRDRADLGRVAMAIWAGLLTFLGVVSLVVIGTLFGQTSLLGPDVVSRMFLVPVVNLFLAAILGPMVVRLVDRDPTALRFI